MRPVPVLRDPRSYGPAQPRSGMKGSSARTMELGVYSRHWYDIIAAVGPSRGFVPPSRAHFDREANGRGALFVGGPEEIAERIIDLHRSVGHMRQFLQSDIGSLPNKEFLRSIELLGTRVKPLVDAELRAPTLQGQAA
jgi:alkanesulfonate monooxygenase SsuD/methylene tetrahydromethanopterin reductase-like flavin-dependent oxidoreductase (luciferase family)